MEYSSPPRAAALPKGFSSIGPLGRNLVVGVPELVTARAVVGITHLVHRDLERRLREGGHELSIRIEYGSVVP